MGEFRKRNAETERRQKLKMNKNKNMPMSLADQRAMLENYNKVRAEKDAKEAEERKAKKAGVKYSSGPAKKPVCAYCKEEGHWLKDNGMVVCPTLRAKNIASRDNNAKRDRLWQNQVSEEVAGETGVGGWETVGGRKNDVRRKKKVGVVVPKNGFDTLAEEEDRMEGVREEEEVAWEVAKEEERKKEEEEKKYGVWAVIPERVWEANPIGVVEKPVLTRALRKTDVNSVPFISGGRRPKSPESPPIPLGPWDSFDH